MKFDEEDITYCDDCDHLHPATRNLHPDRWMCMQARKVESYHSPVSRNAWVDKEPYMRCRGINGGHCKMFEARRDGQKEFI